MRMSCNGCRVLRKGCGEGCSIRPCLQWIKNPEAQANATVFLAKFYGRAGLMNLINAGPDHLRPAIFRSLLYEACGRIVNPIYGSVGLLWSGNWQMCQAAVEAVLKGTPIVQIPSETAASTPTPPLRAYDIRHISKDADRAAAAAAADGVHKVAKSSRTRFKRAAAKPKPASPHPPPEVEREPEPEQAAEAEHSECAPSHESSDASHGHVDDEMAVLEEAHARGEGQEVSVEAGSHVSQAEQSPAPLRQEEADGVELELTLGLPQASRAARPVSADARCDLSIWSAESGHMGLRLELPA